MVNDPNAWMDLQQQFQRLWQTLLQQGNSGSTDEHSPGSAWSQFGFGTNRSQLGPEVFSQWLNKSLRDLLGAPLQGSPFGGGVGSNPFANTGWSVMSPSEFVAMKDLPPLGLNRETELRWRELTEALTDQVNASNQLGRHLAGVYTTALKRFQKSITDNKNDDSEITSLRELYDLWVSIAEQAYAEQVMTPEYSQVFGNCINTSARARKIWQELSDAAQASMNLPNRRELDSVIERQHVLQAEVRALGDRVLSDNDLNALSARIDALSQQLDGLTPAVRNKAPADDHLATKNKNKKPTPIAQASAKIKREGSAAKRPRKAKARSPAARSAHEFDIGTIRSDTGRGQK